MAYSKAQTQKLLEIFGLNKPKIDDTEEKITVHAAVSRFAFFYEKIRNLVDYKDEHLIRKSAILRMLKRLCLLENDPKVIAEQLIRELIAAKYLPNGALPLSLIDEVSWRIYKLQLVLTINAGPESHAEWVRSMIAVELEDLLVDASSEKALASFLFDRISGSIKVNGMEMEQSELKLQIYIAVFRTLFKADDEIIGHKLVRAFFPEWMSPQSWMHEPRPIAERLVAVERRVKLQLKHPLALKFQKVVKPWAVALNILRQVVALKPIEAPAILEKPEALMAAISVVADERYAEARTKVRRATVRATLYLFLTKMVLALILEAPTEWFLYGDLHWKALGVNLLFPPVTMFLVGLFIRIPGTDNTECIQRALDELLNEAPPSTRTISAPPKRSPLAKTMLTLTYSLTFLVTFGGIWFVLGRISFTWVSSLIFIFFLCLVSFFAYRIRMGAREYVVIDGKVTLWSSLVDFFSIPILRAGRFLSSSITRLNVFLFFFDFIFEAPYKMFLGLLEEWFVFAKEKKDELQP